MSFSKVYGKISFSQLLLSFLLSFLWQRLGVTGVTIGRPRTPVSLSIVTKMTHRHENDDASRK